jgi:pyruvate,water dikinase
VKKYILPFNEIKMTDINLVGGKNASLGEMIQFMLQKGINVPNGFAITVEAYDEFIKYNSLDAKIREEIGKCDIDDIKSLSKTGMIIRQLIVSSEFPDHIATIICEEYSKLSALYEQENTDVAVRSSATAEDLPDASFAGQQETYLNVRNANDVLTCVRKCWASLFTDRAISYRSHFNYDHFDVKLSVGIQKMVRTDLAVSGVAFSIDTESGFKDVVLINSSYGLGELIVQGAVSPDEFLVFKPTLKNGFNAIIEKKMGAKDIKMIYDTSSDKRVKTIHVEKKHQKKFSLKKDNILKIAKWVTLIEEYYSILKGHWCPMDVEWGIDGLTNQLFILQARPETIHSTKKNTLISEFKLEEGDKKVLIKGIAVGNKVAIGKVKVLYSMDGRDGTIDGQDFKEGDILVTEMTDPDWEPLMKKASAIITDRGGRTCHAAIIAREMGIPAIVGTLNGSEILNTDTEVTVSCAEGDVGNVYEGIIKYTETQTDLTELPETKTPIMLNVGSPEMAFNFSSYPQKGVGLARLEFIINNYIQVHPMALLKYKELGDTELTEKIENLIQGYDDEQDYFIKKLSYGIAKIGSAFYPNKVIVRFSDFKSNEYYNMLGGKYFEPIEENPMIGWRGASRYYSPAYKAAFLMECKAIRFVREKIGLKNVTVMIPFCRTIEEIKKVLAIMEEGGLRRSDGVEVYLMAEIPSNIILAEQFCQYIDGFSIGSNDLTQLTLGLDRDSSLVAHVYDERNDAVKSMISQLIKTAKRMGKKVGICGQGPSDFPDFAQFLVQEDIDSISVTPDSFLKTSKAIYEIEKEINVRKGMEYTEYLIQGCPNFGSNEPD